MMYFNAGGFPSDMFIYKLFINNSFTMWINNHWGKVIKMVMKKKCDTLLKGIVISMDQERHVFLDGYVAVNKGIIESVGSISECANMNLIINSEEMVLLFYQD